MLAILAVSIAAIAKEVQINQLDTFPSNLNNTTTIKAIVNTTTIKAIVNTTTIKAINYYPSNVNKGAFITAAVYLKYSL